MSEGGKSDLCSVKPFIFAVGRLKLHLFAVVNLLVNSVEVALTHKGF